MTAKVQIETPAGWAPFLFPLTLTNEKRLLLWLCQSGDTPLVIPVLATRSAIADLVPMRTKLLKWSAFGKLLVCSVGSHGSFGSPVSHGSHVIFGFHGSLGFHGFFRVSWDSCVSWVSWASWVSLVSWVKCHTDSLNRSVKIIGIFYFRIFANDMAPCVKNVGGCQCCKGLRWESCNWSKFLSCWLILEVSCGAEDGEHLGERNTTVHCAVRQILAERTEMVCVMAAVMTTVSTETSICQLKILK